MFYVGQEVECVDDRRLENEPGPYVVKGAIYTICEISDWFGEPMLFFNELPIVHHINWSSGYNAKHFRPIQKRTTEISIFTAMLTDKKVDA